MTLEPPGTGPRDPEELEARGTPPCAIAPQTAMGPVALTVADLARSLRYYEETIGLAVRAAGDGRAVLGTAERDLLALVEEPGAAPSDRFTGLFHFALLVPERADLARWLAHAARDGVRLTGASDHFVSEALYLRDPDGHGIEIYADRPREGWGRVADTLTTLPLDLDDILGELEDPRAEPFDGLAAGTVMGHVHLKVADIPDAVAFYGDALGFGVMATIPGQAAFLAAGGYHHHLGANTWQSAGAPPPPPGSAALRHATIVLPDAAERDAVLARLADHGHPAAADAGPDPVVRDPSGNALVLAVAGTSG